MKGPGRGRGFGAFEGIVFYCFALFHKFYNINSCYRSFLFFVIFL